MLLCKTGSPAFLAGTSLRGRLLDSVLLLFRDFCGKTAAWPLLPPAVPDPPYPAGNWRRAWPATIARFGLRQLNTLAVLAKQLVGTCGLPLPVALLRITLDRSCARYPCAARFRGDIRTAFPPPPPPPPTPTTRTFTTRPPSYGNRLNLKLTKAMTTAGPVGSGIMETILRVLPDGSKRTSGKTRERIYPPTARFTRCYRGTAHTVLLRTASR